MAYIDNFERVTLIAGDKVVPGEFYVEKGTKSPWYSREQLEILEKLEEEHRERVHNLLFGKKDEETLHKEESIKTSLVKLREGLRC